MLTLPLLTLAWLVRTASMMKVQGISISSFESPAGCKKGTMIQPFLSDAMVVVISYPLAIIIFITFLVAN